MAPFSHTFVKKHGISPRKARVYPGLPGKLHNFYRKKYTILTIEILPFFKDNSIGF